ncbi:sacsin-like isoform X2 [Cherax quadricarinatus]
MDPSEPEKKMCRILSLNKLMSICPLEDCLYLWSNYLSTQNINDGYFPSTLFWFPLRQSPSELSDTVYSYEHVIKLFESFGVEAAECLTFLKSLEKICLKRIIEDNKLPTITHDVQLNSPFMTEVQGKRKNFRQRLKECNGFPSQAITCCYDVTVKSVQENNTKQRVMRILHYLPGTNETASVTWRGKNSNRHMPLVGVAAPITTHGSPWSNGHIFCFLPLPLEFANNTNLPVQVNGFFALDQNRRHVNWKTEESSDEPEVLWNEELVSKVIVEAYFTLLCGVLEDLKSKSFHMETWYNLLPHINSSKGRWRELATALWSRLKSLPILYSEVKGCMMRPEDVVTDNSLNTWPQHVSSSVRDFLEAQGFPLASVPEPILTSLQSLGVTQLKLFSPRQHGVELLSESAQYVKRSSLSQQQLECWLPKVWSVVQHLNLLSVMNIAFIPSSQNLNSSKLISLSAAIIVQNSRSTLSQTAVEALELLKVQVIPKPPEYVRHHELHSYFNSSDARGVSQALLKVLTMHNSNDLACTFNMWRSDEHVQALLNVTEVHCLQLQIKNLFKALNIFKANGRNNILTDVSINNCGRIFPEIVNFPVSFPETLIVPSDRVSRQLAKNLGATELSKEMLFLLALENTYSDNDTSKLVAYILEDRFLQCSVKIQHQLQFVKFVPNEKGTLFLPNQLYDPDDIDNAALISEDLNPNACFRKYYPILRNLGMKKMQDMPVSKFIQIIKNFQNKSLSEKEKVNKAAALLRATNRHPDCQKICQAVKYVDFVYGGTSKPDGYPNSLSWATTSVAYKPQDIKSYYHFKNSLGSVVPLVHCSDFYNVANHFGWNQKPSVQNFIEHLKNIMNAYQNNEAGYFDLIKETYKQLSGFINTADACYLLSLSTTPCVFTELGFRDPKQVYISSQIGDLLMLPYMYQLPFELRDCASLFSTLGCFETQSKELFLTLLRQIQEHHCSGRHADVDHDRRMVVQVLHKLEQFTKDISPSELLLPVENIDGRLELIEVDQCSYSEQSCNWLDSKDLGVRVIHSSVGTKLAKALGVAPLSKHLLAGQEAFMEWGQHEPLTTRLHNLLRQYRDGVAVLKELVQNADDAGATTISFLYDERQNEDARTRLISDKLQECQGPALWVYNNAFFTEEDFSNIKKLGGGSKEYQTTKIGKFGLGFCSVYNLTDVPSIMSGSNYIMFDPHLTYLDSNSQTPGVRFNFSNERNSFMLEKLHGQFKPFNEVFGCIIQQTKKFDGTLFRFPLRTPAQANNSEISNVSYEHKAMIELLQMFSKIIGELLIFTQNIKEIKVFFLNKSALSPSEKVLLFESSRTMRKVCHSPGNSVFSNRADKTKVERVANLFTTDFKWNRESFQESTFTEIKVVCSEEGGKLCHISKGNWTVNWLISWHCGNGATCKFAEVLRGKALPLGAVAVPLKEQSDGWQPINLSELPPGFYRESHIHCFLPLPVTTPLPVQINGYFEVASDRTSLKTQTEDDRREGLNWNETLINDAVNAAYHSLLSALQLEGLSRNCPYYCIWPVKCDTNDSLVLNLKKHFYDKIVNEDKQVFRSRNKWHPLRECMFLEESFYKLEKIGKNAFEYMENLMESSDLRMIKLPKDIFSGFQFKDISGHMISKDTFFSNYFIPNISGQYVTSEKRNELTLYIMDTQQPCLKKLESVCCIPTIPNGNLKVPNELINPMSRISAMFTVADERFPERLFYDSRYRLSSLLYLGMNDSSIPTEMVSNRAETVMTLPCHNCAVERAFEILYYITTQNPDEQNNIAQRIKAVSFLPVMPKPYNWPLTWKGDMHLHQNSQVCIIHDKLDLQSKLKAIGFSKPADMCLGKFKELVGSTNLLLWLPRINNDKIPKPVTRKLGIIVNDDKLPLNKVCHQLKLLSTVSPVDSNIKDISHKIYSHLERMIQDFNVNPEHLQELRSEKVLLTKTGFMEPNLFAFSSETDCSPDLFSVEVEGLGKYTRLMEALGIKSTFHVDAVFEVLSQKQEKYKLEKLSELEILQISKLLTLLFNVRETSSSNYQLPLHLLHLPDADGYLCPINKLCWEDGVELSSSGFHCLHKHISLSLEMTKWLGIKTKTRQRLENSSNRMHFGQKEPLTVRLKNILKEYPCDYGIMKELLQNADDAGATEVAFIKDFRRLSTEKLFDKQWAPLQGPALSVYNNKCFTEKDLQNIQDLGNSTKNLDPASTGQYGIGFNAVYHITDAPSFLTRGPAVPQGETLCMFDPHCKYDPMATPEKPGVQFVNLNDLRKDHPDSFQGYLEDIFLQHEGTVFRLPLRSETSDIAEPFQPYKLKDKLREFQAEMAKCLLFLRNVRKISIMNITETGECDTEYSVESSIHQQNELSKLQSMMKERKPENFVLNIDMMRACYTMKIADSNNDEYTWYIVQQLGTENKDSVPEIIQHAFTNRYLSLLPHAGAAVLLETNNINTDDLYTTSCYLPLPTKSGLPFSINGHFTLNSSRRNLWTGIEDCKDKWNSWLMKEVLVPAAVYAVDHYRKSIFPDNNIRMTLSEYTGKISLCRKAFPNGINAQSETWKNFTKWFYEYIIDQQLHFFDVFVLDNDYDNSSLTENRQNVNQPQNGELNWHALRKNGNEFPVYFSDDRLLLITILLRRLGMKVGSSFMCCILQSVGIEYLTLTPDIALEFLHSWDDDYPDKCNPMIMKHITETPFLCTENVCNLFKYLSNSQNFLSKLERLPLLLTNDKILKYFDTNNPLFISSYCPLLLNSGNEFLNSDMVELVENTLKNFTDQSVLKRFTLKDLADRLHRELGQEYHACEDILPLGGDALPDVKWLDLLWSFIVNYVEENFYCSDKESDKKINYVKGHQYIQKTLGDWALYPLIDKKRLYVIAVKNAWRVLDRNDPAHCSDSLSVFHRLPVPNTYSDISHTLKLNLAATLRDPSVVLDNLYFHRERIAEYVYQGAMMDNANAEKMTEVLEYFGQYCERVFLSKAKLSSLSIFEDVSGVVQKLEDIDFIVPDSSKLTSNFRDLAKLAKDDNIIILKTATSDKIKHLYQYLNKDCYMEDLEIYANIILPKYTNLQENQRTNFMNILRDELTKLQHKKEDTWEQSQKNVVLALKKTPIINLNGIFTTADHFYDPDNPVFKVMELNNLPPEWQKREWSYFLKLAGMVHELTAEMYVQYASELTSADSNVKLKSKILTTYLFDNFDKLKSRCSQIRKIEFLAPEESERLKQILPYFKTASGLVSFSGGVPSKFSDLLWTTTSLLPQYASNVAYSSHAQEDLNILKTPPQEKVLEHISKLCTFLTSKQENSSSTIVSVMESIYQHLHHSLHDVIAYQTIPLVHLPSQKTFVTANLVVENLEGEIIPYLYKAPITYGKYIDLFKKLGAVEVATCDTYAQVLKMIYNRSQQQKLHPEEWNCMKLALQGLHKNILKLKNVTAAELYLPTKEGKLEKSSEMYVADIEEYLDALKGKLNESIFIGFHSLKIPLNDADFVKLLPSNLQPKLLSHAVKEDLESNTEEITTKLLKQLRELLYSNGFKMAVLRIINHDYISQGIIFTEAKAKELMSIFDKVDVKQVKTITTNLKVNQEEVGKRNRKYFVKVSNEGERKVTLYICENITNSLLTSGLRKTYRKLLNLTSVIVMDHLASILSSYEKPHDIPAILNELNITAWKVMNTDYEFYPAEVGSYLNEELIPLLDNEFYKFHEGEIVCMKKYILGEVEDGEDPEENIYTIVQVKRLVRRHDNVFMDEYEVETGYEIKSCVIVRSHQLYKFVRPAANDCSDIMLADHITVTDDVSDNLAEKEIMKMIKKQIQEIWKVTDEKERRHLLRRLILKWHPDKNSHRVELCTRVMQYIQHLMKRLENGEDISDEDVNTSYSDFFRDTGMFRTPNEDVNTSYSNSDPSDFFFRDTGMFRRPRRQKRSSYGFFRNRTSEEKMPDYPESMKWLKQAEHDFAEANQRHGESSCWIMYMCYQAAEKILKAALYLEDRSKAAKFHWGGEIYSLLDIASNLKSSESCLLASDLETRVGHHTNLRYPSMQGCPCDYYTSDDASYMLSKTEKLMELLRPCFAR